MKCPTKTNFEEQPSSRVGVSNTRLVVGLSSRRTNCAVHFLMYMAVSGGKLDIDDSRLQSTKRALVSQEYLVYAKSYGK